MKIETLCIGLVVKNYKTMCELLGQEPKTSNSKKAQIKEWERYFKFHKEGQRIIIDEIYDIEKPSTDKRKLGNNSVYGEELRNLILYILATSDELYDCEPGRKSLTIPRTLLLRKLHMVNSNYATGRREQGTLSEIMCMDNSYVNDFYNTTHDNLKKSLETALDQLENMRLIDWGKENMACKKQAVFEFNEVNEIVIGDDHNPKCNIREVYKPLTDDEADYIRRVELDLLKEYKVEYVTDLYGIGKIHEFYSRANKIIKDNTNILYYFSGYKIQFSKDVVIDKLDSLGIDVDEIKSIINKKVKEKALDNARNRSNKALDEYYKTDKIDENKKVRTNDDYVLSMDLLITILIDIEAIDIRKDILKRGQLNLQ